MLVRRCVEYNINMLRAENMLELFPVSYRCDLHLKRKVVAVFADKLLLYFISVIFLNIEYYQVPGF